MSNKLRTDLIFPDPLEAGEDGILAFGGYLDNASLYHAYRRGIFPWPHGDLPLLWFFPWRRGVLFFNEIHISKSCKKLLRQHTFKITQNKDFRGVIKSCQQQLRPGQQGTWITEDMLQAYCEFHHAGYAHSIEAWDGAELVGGIYGVLVEGVFSAESMFFKKTGASKVCFIELTQWLSTLDIKWMDVQMLTPLSQSFGAREISREEYLLLLKESQK